MGNIGHDDGTVLRDRFIAQASVTLAPSTEEEKPKTAGDIVKRGNAWQFIQDVPLDAKAVENSEEIVGRLTARLSVHPQAREYLETFAKLNGKIRVMPEKNMRGLGGGFSPEEGRIYLNGDLSENEMLGFLAHELRHAVHQDVNQGTLDMSIDAVNDYTFMGVYGWLFSMEADAQTFATDVMHYLSQNGDRGPLATTLSLGNNYTSVMAAAYQRQLSTEPGNLDLARAKAFETWFSTDVYAVYAAQAKLLYIQSLKNIGFDDKIHGYAVGHDKKNTVGLKTFGPDELDSLAAIGGGNYAAHVHIDPSNFDYIRAMLTKHDKNFPNTEKEVQGAVDAYLRDGIPPVASLPGFGFRVYTKEEVAEHEEWSADPRHNYGIQLYFEFKQAGLLKYINDFAEVEAYFSDIDPDFIHTANFETYGRFRQQGYLKPETFFDPRLRPTPPDIDAVLAEARNGPLTLAYYALQDAGDKKLQSAYENLLRATYKLSQENPVFSHIKITDAKHPIDDTLGVIQRYLLDKDAKALYQDLYWHEFPGLEDYALNHLKPEIEELVRAAYEREKLPLPNFNVAPFQPSPEPIPAPK